MDKLQELADKLEKEYPNTEAVEVDETITYFDLKSGTNRPITQGDVDLLQRTEQAYGRLFDHLSLGLKEMDRIMGRKGIYKKYSPSKKEIEKRNKDLKYGVYADK